MKDRYNVLDIAMEKAGIDKRFNEVDKIRSFIEDSRLLKDMDFNIGYLKGVLHGMVYIMEEVIMHMSNAAISDEDYANLFYKVAKHYFGLPNSEENTND